MDATGILDMPRSKPNDKENRLNLRADAEWLARVRVAAKRKGLEVSSYVRMVITERMDADQVPKPRRPD